MSGNQNDFLLSEIRIAFLTDSVRNLPPFLYISSGFQDVEKISREIESFVNITYINNLLHLFNPVCKDIH